VVHLLFADWTLLRLVVARGSLSQQRTIILALIVLVFSSARIYNLNAVDMSVSREVILQRPSAFYSILWYWFRLSKHWNCTGKSCQ
jgi:hypothetical protein